MIILWNLHIWDSTLTKIGNLSYLISKGWIIMLRYVEIECDSYDSSHRSHHMRKQSFPHAWPGISSVLISICLFRFDTLVVCLPRYMLSLQHSSWEHHKRHLFIEPIAKAKPYWTGHCVSQKVSSKTWDMPSLSCRANPWHSELLAEL